MNEKINILKENISRSIVGKDDVIIKIIAALLCEGHVLIEDVPGVGKTQLISSLSKSLGGKFNRVQMTPDIMPSDIIGFSMVNGMTGEFEYKPGAALCNFLLADEINHKADKNDRVNIVTDFKRHQLCGHGCTDIGTKNNRNCLRQAHQSRADKTNGHDCGCRAALQNSGYQSASQRTHNRVSGQITEYLLHPRSGCLLQGVTHAVHAKQEHGKTTAKAKYRCEYVVHNFLL